MKPFVYLLVFILVCKIGFSQNKLQDGIYRIDPSSINTNGLIAKDNKATVQFNPSFFEGDPDTYKPLVVFTDEFVAFKLTAAPVIQHRQGSESEVLVHLTANAAEQLKEFTEKNIQNQVAVIIDGQVIAIYKLFQPVTGGVIKITKCTGSACGEISRQLKIASKS